MKISVISIFLFCAFVSFGQNQSSKSSIVSEGSATAFSLSFTTFNHTERIFDGTITYILTPSSIKVTKTFFGETKSKLVYSKRLPKTDELFSIINQLGLDSLKDFYFNYCVMVTSGDEYFLDFATNSTKKSISLHHYYLKQLADIIQVINSKLPRKHQFQYLTKDTKQDCSL